VQHCSVGVANGCFGALRSLRKSWLLLRKRTEAINIEGDVWVPISRPKVMAVPVLWHRVPQFGPCQLRVLFSGDDCPWRGKGVGRNFSSRWHFLVVESFIPVGDAEFHRVDMFSHKAWLWMVRSCERCGRPQGPAGSGQ